MSREFIQKPFIAIPPALFQEGNGLNAFAIAVWCALARWADTDTGKCWRPIRLLAKDIEQSERTVRRAISTLKKKGWVKVILHKGAHSEYRLIWGGSTSMSMQFTEESAASQTPLDENTTSKAAQQKGKGEKWCPTGLTSAAPQADDLYSLSILRKINRETSSKMTKTKQSQSPDFSALFDSKSGHFVLGAAARQKLLDDAPNVDLDATLKIIEARRLSDKKAQPIQNVLAYLERCLLKPGCVMKKGALITFSDGHTGRVKVYTDEELNQREQREKARQSKPVSKGIEDLAAKWGS